jgi:lipopolysaccharide transport system permease protein
MVADLWRYRGFVFGMVKREFQLRYLNSLLGSTWALLSSLGLILIYTVIFGRIMRARAPGVDDSVAYTIFLCAGVTTWAMFTEVIQRCMSIFIDHSNLLKKVSFPRATLPVIVLLSAAVNFSLVFGLLLLLLGATGRFPGSAVVAVLPLLLVQQALALGLGVALGVVNVFFRDVAHAVTVLLQFWFWLTPIVYPRQILGAAAQRVLDLNPLTQVMMSYQGILLRGAWPDWSHLVFPTLCAAAALGIAVTAFRRLAGEMVDCL